VAIRRARKSEVDVTTHVLFDFFGTLVEYSPSRTEQGYERSFALLRDAGCPLGYESFLAQWSQVSSEFDRIAERSYREFSMVELADTFLDRTLGRAPAGLSTRFVETYLAEWNTGVRYPTRLRELLVGLSRRFTLAVVTNTHHPQLVPTHLEQMGVADLFAVVVTSVEHGRRKPALEIFQHALQEIGGTASSSVYVGDSYEADYRGATGAGMSALLIDPHSRSPVPACDRLASVFDLESRLA
jgi:putative hydrolase of the HAD superfamily